MRQLRGLRRDSGRCRRGSQSRCIELLVDADTHSIVEIRSGIKTLELESGLVRTSIFGPPGLIQNQRWQELFLVPEIVFEPVQRASSRKGEANDSAIAARVRALCHSGSTVSIAMMISDAGYLDVIQESMEAGKDIRVVCPENKFNVIRKFGGMGVPIAQVPISRDSRSRVRAILDEDGEGHVCLAEPYRAYDSSDIEQTVREFLQKLGCANVESRYLIHSVAKFWLANALGSLTVFPSQCAVEALSEVIAKCANQSLDARWRCPGSMAFFLPMSNVGRISRSQASRYGSSLARAAFQGGGPFILHDSVDIVSKALQKLGYFDSELTTTTWQKHFWFSSTMRRTNIFCVSWTAFHPAKTLRQPCRNG